MAREAGLSRATVSYVLNNVPRAIPDSTRQRVFDAAARLGYGPSAAARTLRRGRSDLVLCLLPDWPIGPTVGAVLEAMSTTLADNGLVFVVHTRTRQPITDVWRAITPAAVVSFESLTDADAAGIHAAGVALSIVMIGAAGQGQQGLLDIPERSTGRLQVQHLVAAGHHRLGYAFPDDARLLPFAHPRLDGVRQECAERGLDPPSVHTVPATLGGGTSAVHAWQASEPAITGICAYNDDIALAVLAGIRHLNLTAPTDLAVIGVDDIPAAATAAPPLTTIKINATALAQHITRNIIDGLTGKAPPLDSRADIFTVLSRDST